MTLDSLVTAMPLPGVTWPAGEEVRRPLVLHFLGEPQQHTGVIVSGTGSVGRAAGQSRGTKQKNTGHTCTFSSHVVFLGTPQPPPSSETGGLSASG